MVWRSASQAQKILLIALSKDQSAKPFSKDFQLKHGIGPSSSIKASLDSLLKKGILYRTLEGSYRFADLFMPYWIDYIRKYIRQGRDHEMKTAYLSGPIMDEHEGVARKWREIAKSLLAPNFRLLNPMRRNFRDKEVDSANEIVEFDLQDVRDADIVLVNYCKPSIGTSMEVFYASHDL